MYMYSYRTQEHMIQPFCPSFSQKWGKGLAAYVLLVLYTRVSITFLFYCCPLSFLSSTVSASPSPGILLTHSLCHLRVCHMMCLLWGKPRHMALTKWLSLTHRNWSGSRCLTCPLLWSHCHLGNLSLSPSRHSREYSTVKVSSDSDTLIGCILAPYNYSTCTCIFYRRLTA